MNLAAPLKTFTTGLGATIPFAVFLHLQCDSGVYARAGHS